MKLGIGLPNTLVPDVNRGMVLEWARAADHAGFHSFGTIDRPSQDVWDPLIALAAAAAVTERVRLATTRLQLPHANELVVAKPAAEKAGKTKFQIGGLAYVAIGDDPTAAWAAAARSYRRYYGDVSDADLSNRILAGPVDVVAQAVKEYEPAGLDVLWLFSWIPDVKQV